MKNEQVSLYHIEYEIVVGHSLGKVKDAGGDVRLRRMGKAGGREVRLGVSSIEMVP